MEVIDLVESEHSGTVLNHMSPATLNDNVHEVNGVRHGRVGEGESGEKTEDGERRNMGEEMTGYVVKRETMGHIDGLSVSDAEMQSSNDRKDGEGGLRRERPKRMPKPRQQLYEDEGPQHLSRGTSKPKRELTMEYMKSHLEKAMIGYVPGDPTGDTLTTIMNDDIIRATPDMNGYMPIDLNHFTQKQLLDMAAETAKTAVKPAILPNRPPVKLSKLAQFTGQEEFYDSKHARASSKSHGNQYRVECRKLVDLYLQGDDETAWRMLGYEGNPRVNGKYISFSALVKAVLQRGGYQRAIDNLQWSAIARCMGINVTHGKAGHALRLLYRDKILPCEPSLLAVCPKDD